MKGRYLIILSVLVLLVFEEDSFWVMYGDKNDLIPGEGMPYDFHFKFSTPTELNRSEVHKNHWL